MENTGAASGPSADSLCRRGHRGDMRVIWSCARPVPHRASRHTHSFTPQHSCRWGGVIIPNVKKKTGRTGQMGSTPLLPPGALGLSECGPRAQMGSLFQIFQTSWSSHCEGAPCSVAAPPSTPGWLCLSPASLSTDPQSPRCPWTLANVLFLIPASAWHIRRPGSLWALYLLCPTLVSGGLRLPCEPLTPNPAD